MNDNNLDKFVGGGDDCFCAAVVLIHDDSVGCFVPDKIFAQGLDMLGVTPSEVVYTLVIIAYYRQVP